MWELTNMARTQDEDEALVDKTIKEELSTLVGAIRLNEIVDHRPADIRTPREVRTAGKAYAKDRRVTARKNDA